MENESPYMDEGRSSRRNRLMGKLFGGRERKVDVDNAANVDAFLHSTADNLEVFHAPPPPPPPSTIIPKLAKLDTSISRYPQALAVNQQAQLNRPIAPGRHESNVSSRVPRPNKKGLLVRFVDSYPEIIGEGGDESEIPTVEISKRKPAAPRPPQHRSPQPSPGRSSAATAQNNSARAEDDFQPKALKRTQTGFSSIYEPDPDQTPTSTSSSKHLSPVPTQNTVLPGRSSSTSYLETSGRHDENRRSFIEVHQAQMREAEGQAFAKAARTASAASPHDWEDRKQFFPPESDSPPAATQRPVSLVSTNGAPPPPPAVTYSPVASLASTTSSMYSPKENSQMDPRITRQLSVASQLEPPPMAARAASFKLHDVVTAAGDDALNMFVARTRHLFELFRLHAESVKPVSSSPPQGCARAALWWFLKGRMGLESAVRERPTTSQGQMHNELDRQQAYTNLAKGYWLCQEIIPTAMQAQGLAPDPEVAEVAQGLVSALRKLAMSMKRNGFLPPEEAFLPQTIDKSIWIEYQTLSQDMIALLSGNWGSTMTAMQSTLSSLHLLDAFPIGDTNENFCYGRVAADIYLMEQGRDSQRIYFPCLVSMVRPQKLTGLVFVLASQNGSIQLPIQETRSGGAAWDDVRWRSETCTLDVRLPRGFMLVVQLSQQDYKMAYSMYEFFAKTRATLFPRSDEEVAIRTNLRSFQYMDSDPQSRVFPKEAILHCEVALFERIHKENGPSGPRSWHRGFRVAVVTGPRTRTLNGVNHSFPPQLPIQFGFFRAEGDMPALSLKFDDGRRKGRMVLVFADEKERIKFHSTLTGTALDHDEKIFADVPLKGFMIAQSLREPTGMAPFSRMPWKAARVVNDESNSNGDLPPTVLADRLKVVFEYQNGTITDRVNVAPGELRMRLEVSNAKVLRVLRQPQYDITMSVSEAQVPKEVPRGMTDALQLIQQHQTIRSMEFNNIQDLHAFQFALTGFEVMFDALAVTFAIARRRMVVPIHKKWEAGYTRIQIVRQEDKQLQLLAFFEDFVHGHCMNFVLKGTDNYESISRSGKSGIRFLDAKFPLPRLPADKDQDFDDMAFVCLDLPDLPGEHDDISIWFEKETGEYKISRHGLRIAYSY
ncbi:hypothetical protein HJFPF1_03063 [Paramyrothecium foliicola]|nr:hypothetical protein HJFPF1_03063 [Paramyrothecium foliicola]